MYFLLCNKGWILYRNRVKNSFTLLGRNKLIQNILKYEIWNFKLIDYYNVRGQDEVIYLVTHNNEVHRFTYSHKSKTVHAYNIISIKMLSYTDSVILNENGIVFTVSQFAKFQLNRDFKAIKIGVQKYYDCNNKVLMLTDKNKVYVCITETINTFELNIKDKIIDIYPNCTDEVFGVLTINNVIKYYKLTDNNILSELNSQYYVTHSYHFYAYNLYYLSPAAQFKNLPKNPKSIKMYQNEYNFVTYIIDGKMYTNCLVNKMIKLECFKFSGSKIPKLLDISKRYIQKNINKFKINFLPNDCRKLFNPEELKLEYKL